MNNAEILNVTVVPSVGAGQVFSAIVTVRNTGATLWSESTRHRLGTCDQTLTTDDTRWTSSRWVIPPGVTIRPGETHTFVASGLMWQGSLGSYLLRFKMLQETIEWFGNSYGSQVTITAPIPEERRLSQLVSWRLHNDLVGCQLFNSGPFSANLYNTNNGGVLGQQILVNDLADIVEVRHLRGWIGVDIGGIGDIAMPVSRHNPVTQKDDIFYNQSWDHYGDPNLLHDTHLHFGPRELLIYPNEILKMIYWFNEYQPQVEPAKNGHCALEAWVRKYVI